MLLIQKQNHFPSMFWRKRITEAVSLSVLDYNDLTCRRTCVSSLSPPDSLYHSSITVFWMKQSNLACLTPTEQTGSHTLRQQHNIR